MNSLLTLLIWNVALAAILALSIALLSYLRPLRDRPALRHSLWLLVLLKLVTPPLIPVPILLADSAEVNPTRSADSKPRDLLVESPIEFDRQSSVKTHIEEHRQAVATPDPKDALHTNFDGEHLGANGIDGVKPSWKIRGLLVLVSFSVLVTLVLSIRGVSQMCKVSRLLHRADWDDERLKRISGEESEKLGVNRSMGICVVNAYLTPLLWVRWRYPVVVIPRVLVEQLSDEQVKHIVCHELAHFVRRDHWSNTLAFFVTALFWWNPVVWWARREMRIAQEVCCDALVVRNSSSIRRSYAETLLQVIEFIGRDGPLVPQLASGFGEGNSIRRRFEMIANDNVRYRLSIAARLLILCVLVAACCYPVLAQTAPEREDTSPNRKGGDLKQRQSRTHVAESDSPPFADLQRIHDEFEQRSLKCIDSYDLSPWDVIAQRHKCAECHRSVTVDSKHKEFGHRAHNCAECHVGKHLREAHAYVLRAKRLMIQPVFAAEANQFEFALAREVLSRFVGTFKGAHRNELDGTTSDAVTITGRWLPGMRYFELRSPVSFSILMFDAAKREFRHWNFVDDGNTNEVVGTFAKPEKAGVAIVWKDRFEDGGTSVTRWTFPTNNHDIVIWHTINKDKAGKVIVDGQTIWTRTQPAASGEARKAEGPTTAKTQVDDSQRNRPIDFPGIVGVSVVGLKPETTHFRTALLVDSAGHVLVPFKRRDSIPVSFGDGNRSLARFVAEDEEFGFSAYKVDRLFRARPVEFASSMPKKGDEVRLMGRDDAIRREYNRGIACTIKKVRETMRFASADGVLEFPNCLKLDAFSAEMPAVVDRKGRIVGLCFGGYFNSETDYDSFAYSAETLSKAWKAIQLKMVKDADDSDQTLDEDQVKRMTDEFNRELYRLGIGVKVLTTPKSVRGHLSLGNMGVTVVAAKPGSPAHNAGIRPYDVIVKVNNKPISTPREFIAGLQKSPRAKVQVQFNRKGQTKTVEVGPVQNLWLSGDPIWEFEADHAVKSFAESGIVPEPTFSAVPTVLPDGAKPSLSSENGQFPNFAFTPVFTTISVPDGGSVLLHGIKRREQTGKLRGR